MNVENNNNKTSCGNKSWMGAFLAVLLFLVIGATTTPILQWMNIKDKTNAYYLVINSDGSINAKGNFGITNAAVYDQHPTNTAANPLFVKPDQGTNSVVGFEVACTNAFTLEYTTTALTNGQVLAHGIVTNFFRTVGGSTTLQSCAVTIPGTNQWIPLCVHYYSRSTEGATASFTNGVAYVYAPTSDDLLYHARAVHLVQTNISVGWLKGVPFNPSVTNWFVHEPEYNLGTPIVNRNADQNLYYVVVADAGCFLTNGLPVTGYGFRLRTTGFQDQ